MKRGSIFSAAAGLIVGASITFAVCAKTRPWASNRVDSAVGPNSMAQMDTSDHSMATALRDKEGDDFDKMFISSMIDHHQSAIDMANLTATRAKHAEIKELGRNIVSAQSGEISQMKTWYSQWGYLAEDQQATPHTH